MADTIREQIIQDFLDRLEDWTTLNGYNYGCGLNVFRATSNVESDNLPAVVLWPKESTPDARYNGVVWDMLVKIEAIAAPLEDQNMSVVQEMLIGDAIKILDDRTSQISDLIDDVKITRITPCDAQDPETTTTGIEAVLSVKFSTVVGDPYSQE